MAISTVAEFLECIERSRSDDETELLYRGQADAKWIVDCSAVRRLRADHNFAIDSTLIGHALVGYLDDLLNKASQYVGKCPELPGGCTDLEVLAQLQHQGAATGLIDFTLEPLVSLWFACSGYPTEDGAVYVLSRSDVQETDEAEVRENGVLKYFYGAGTKDWDDPPYLWCPGAMYGRPASQESVFILGVPFLWPALLNKIVIDKNFKQPLLEELRIAHGIAEEKLFPDLSGYAHANSVSKPFDMKRFIRFWENRVEWFTNNAEKAQAYVDCGLAHAAIKQYEFAIERYTEAITFDAENIGAYVNRARTRQLLGDQTEALADYNTALLMCGRAEGLDSRQIARVHWNRGQAYFALGQEEQGCADYNRAIGLGHKLYFYDNGKDGARINAHPEYLEEYKPFTNGEDRSTK